MSTPHSSDYHRSNPPGSLRSVRLSQEHLYAAVATEMEALPGPLRDELGHIPSSLWAKQNPRLACAALRALRHHPNLLKRIKELRKKPDMIVPTLAVESGDVKLLGLLVESAQDTEHREKILRVTLERAVVCGKDVIVAAALRLGAKA